MLRLTARRVAQSVVVLLLVSAITFLLVNLAPGGPASIMSMEMTADQRATLIRRMGLDQPVPVRYVAWLGQAVRGDLGTSFLANEPVSKRIGERLPATLQLAGLALGLSIVLGIPMGVVAALRRGTPIDYLMTTLSVLGLSLPSFWLGIILILIFSVTWKVLPSSGLATTGIDFDLKDRLLHLIMPTVVLSTTVLPTVVRFTRSALLEVLHQDYVRTATSKGLSRLTVVYGHALRNALVPVVSVVGTLIPRLIGGAVITEAIFGWPGMGRLALEAANGRDYPLIMGITMTVALVVVVSTLVVDLAYGVLDPRVRLT